MTWRVAESLEVLRKQLNTAFPKRSKVSDGSIGDAAHASRNSDHNPWVKDAKGQGIVTARDFTHDPKTGIDCQWLADTLVDNKDPRIKYIIWNKRICSSTKGWEWRPYKGINAHQHHLHLSVNAGSEDYDSTQRWTLGFADNDDADDIATVSAADPDSPAAAIPPAAPGEPEQSGVPAQNRESTASTDQPPSTVKFEITPEGGVKGSSTTDGSPPAPKERIAVVQTQPQKWSSRVTAKITGAVTGNALFQWIWAQVDKIQGLAVPDMVWVIVSVTIAVGSLLWIIYEIVDTWRRNKYQESIDNLLVKENSTPENLVQLIPADEIDLYRYRGFKIITRGESAGS